MTRAIRDSDDILVCRLINGKVTLVHRRLWPALVRAASHLPPDRLSQLREVHTSSGHQVTKEVPVPFEIVGAIEHVETIASGIGVEIRARLQKIHGRGRWKLLEEWRYNHRAVDGVGRAGAESQHQVSSVVRSTS